ncbi:RNA methyltransferase [Thalassotalea euphylliae]|uniref:TrmH family RNA methyltransferase n=1 Tax=Thalassotalea euphylliae TaxID=1655234 RepID=A0A3E0U3P8_9GAMM|nr:RNA methyltransferase [Thalassotalea euphylliae]REL31556.1 TrmH family RNA methyltransferase [Thalassotalea euphylliae]
MARLKQTYAQNGFFGIGIMNNVDEINIGTLWRSAYILGAAFIFTVDKKYKKQTTDVVNAWQKIPLYHYNSIDELVANLPYDTPLIGVELDENAHDITRFEHPHRCVYLLGNEQSGLPPQALEKCHRLVQLPGDYSLNVSVAGSIVMYDRLAKLS